MVYIYIYIYQCLFKWVFMGNCPPPQLMFVPQKYDVLIINNIIILYIYYKSVNVFYYVVFHMQLKTK